MMAASNTTNPFSDLYSAISGRGVSPAASMVVTVFFPFAREPAGEPMRLSVRKDATVEEVLGFGLWSYWEAGWLPRLDDVDIDSNASEKLSAVGWVMKIAEDDGEVDEDFPRKSSPRFFSVSQKTHFSGFFSLAPNRELKISGFNLEAYAVLEANTTQGRSNSKLDGDSFQLMMVFPSTSATEQDAGRKDTAQSVTRRQYQEGRLVQRDTSAPFHNRTKQ